LARRIRMYAFAANHAPERVDLRDDISSSR
jgi:hypothetical protein